MVCSSFSIRISINVSICVALPNAEAHILRFVLIKKSSCLTVRGDPRFLDLTGDQVNVVIALLSACCVIGPLVCFI